jgi:hypothetical protein
MVNEDISERALLIQEIYKQHGLTKQKEKMLVNPDYTCDPPTDRRAREKIEKHVTHLMNSFCKTGTINDQVVLVFFFDALDEKFEDFLNFNRDTFKLEKHEKILKGYLEAIAGMHTSTACRRLKKKFPKNDFWKTLSASVLLLPFSEKSLRFVNIVGLSTNQHDGLHMTTFDVLVNIRKKSQSLYEKIKPHLINADVRESLQMSKNAYGQHKALALISEENWDLVVKLFKGDGTPLKFKKPTAMTHFVRMGGIPESAINRLLASCLTGDIGSMKAFANECIRYKVRSRIADLITAEVFDDPSKTFAQVQEEYPCFTAKFVELNMPSFESLKKKDPPPKNFMANIRRMRDRHDSAKQRQEEYKQECQEVCKIISCAALNCCCFYFCHNFY